MSDETNRLVRRALARAAPSPVDAAAAEVRGALEAHHQLPPDEPIDSATRRALDSRVDKAFGAWRKAQEAENRQEEAPVAVDQIKEAFKDALREENVSADERMARGYAEGADAAELRSLERRQDRGARLSESEQTRLVELRKEQK